ncbi:MAG TPA: hypothetical protein VM913_03305 [Sphingomicrobium sp.]|nr:hypothetical protein [Sphingomicrobium sp.]
MNPDMIESLQVLFPMIALLSIVPVTGWVITTWMRIKHGYPLDGQWGQALHPKSNPLTERQIEALASDNAALRSELHAIKARLASVETIVTDGGVRLSNEIDRLSMTHS